MRGAAVLDGANRHEALDRLDDAVWAGVAAGLTLGEMVTELVRAYLHRGETADEQRMRASAALES